MDIACRAAAGSSAASDGLIASTDADTIVAADWLAAQLALARGGRRGDRRADRARPERASGARPRGPQRAPAPGAAQRLASRLGAGAPAPRSSSTPLLRRVARADRRRLPPLRRAAGARGARGRGARRGAHPARASRSTAAGGCACSTSARTDGRAPRGLAQDLTRADWRARRRLPRERVPARAPARGKQQHGRAAAARPRSRGDDRRRSPRPPRRLRDAGLLDEVLVDRRRLRRRAPRRSPGARGSRSHRRTSFCAEYGPARGKGDAMWRGLAATDSEIVAFADTDTEDFHEGFLLGLLGPLLCDPDGPARQGRLPPPLPQRRDRARRRRRPRHRADGPTAAEPPRARAGRLRAAARRGDRRPPRAARADPVQRRLRRRDRDADRRLARRRARAASPRSTSATRQNRHQSLRDLSAMAYAVLVAAQTRFLGRDFADTHACGSIVLPPAPAAEPMEHRRVTVEERPPLAEHRSSAGTLAARCLSGGCAGSSKEAALVLRPGRRGYASDPMAVGREDRQSRRERHERDRRRSSARPARR